MIRLPLFVGMILVVSCKAPEERIVEGRENWVDAIIVSNEGTDSVFFHDCYCNIVNSRIILNHVYLGGMHGGSLTTNISQDSVYFDLRYWPYDFKTFSFDKKEVYIENSERGLGKIISGKLSLSGESKSRNEDSYIFSLNGRFKCVLRDSTYGHMAWYNDFLNRHDSLKMIELREIAQKRPDSVTELQLNYKNFHLIKDNVSSFKNIQRLVLSDFPFIDAGIISNFEFVRELRIVSDNLRELPSDIGGLRNLEVLIISSPIDEIPTSLFSLTKLKELDLGVTGISEISGEIKKLKDLEKLNIVYSDITQFPNEIFDLPRLTDLGLPAAIQLFKLKKINPTLTKLETTFEFLNYNEESLKILQNLETITVSFHYKDFEEEGRLHSKNISMLKTNLPKVNITDILYFDE